MALAPLTEWSIDSSVRYLNHGSFGAVPREVTAAQQLIREQMERNPNEFVRSHLPTMLRNARARCAAELGTVEERLAFVPNASQGVIAAAAAVVRRGTKIATTTTNYGGVVLGLRALAQRADAHLIELPAFPPTSATPETCVAEIAEHIGDADVLVLDHIVATSAQLNPVADIARAVRTVRPDCFIVVDAAHAVGQLHPAIPAGVDAWISNFHKWIASPRPSAALVAVSDRAARVLEPLAGSWNAELGFPLSFDAQGTSDLSAYLATPAAFDFLARWPREARDRHCRETVSAAADMLAQAWGVRLPTHPRLQAPYMRVVPFPGERRFTTQEENAAIVTARQQFRAEIAVTSPGGISGVRLSAFLYNDVADYECLRDLPRVLPR
ncbi:MAG: aminotransferase class V-fold PLP-dependent enzyme [Ilumatobacteraceae bacterium]